MVMAIFRKDHSHPRRLATKAKGWRKSRPCPYVKGFQFSLERATGKCKLQCPWVLRQSMVQSSRHSWSEGQKRPQSRRWWLWQQTVWRTIYQTVSAFWPDGGGKIQLRFWSQKKKIDIFLIFYILVVFCKKTIFPNILFQNIDKNISFHSIKSYVNMNGYLICIC